ncbi:hypothetical protein N0V95_004608 [Ascochyta clinopodiicola]|nr:hypothetical protein N0V95_004608 [Ascochyta clinopodiicola]
MKEAIISKDTVVTVRDVDIPTPNDDQVLIKVVVTGTNPKDWKIPILYPGADANQGDDIAGIVHAVGQNVVEFKTGDRVAAFHEIATPGGSFAEYAIAWAYTTFHIPKSVTFEAAATIPLAAMTSAIGLYSPEHLGLPNTFTPATQRSPLIIYGAASAVGAFALQLAKQSNIHPIIAVAGRGIPFVESLVDRNKGDTIVDYRQGDAAVVQGLKDATNGFELLHAFDAISEKNSYVNIAEVLASGGKVATVWRADAKLLPKNVTASAISVLSVHQHEKELGHAYFRIMARGLQDGWFNPHPYEVVPGGLHSLDVALLNLRDGKASALKYVVRIEETQDL